MSMYLNVNLNISYSGYERDIRTYGRMHIQMISHREMLYAPGLRQARDNKKMSPSPSAACTAAGPYLTTATTAGKMNS